MQKANYIKRIKNFKFKKSLGQNFLVDENAINKIIKELPTNSNIVEIGAGAGFVTEELVKFFPSVKAIEIDKNVIPILDKNCQISIINSPNKCNFEIIEQDILKTDFSKITDSKVCVVANIPYYITSPILVHLLGEIDDINNKNRNLINEIILMVQYEVAKRLVATNKSTNIKEYGMLSILSQFWADVEIISKVPKTSFYPSPKVDSALVKIKINNTPIVPVNPYLKKVIKSAFSTRRKTLKNCLVNSGFKNSENALSKLGFDPNIRGEKLSIQDFSLLSKELYEESNN